MKSIAAKQMITMNDANADFGLVFNNDVNCQIANITVLTIVMKNNTLVQLSNKPVYIGSFISTEGSTTPPA